MEHTPPRAVLLLALSLLTSCNSYSDLGGNFKLYEYDREDVFIGYCFNDCGKSSLPVVPRTVVEVNHDADWIVARTRSRSAGSAYWIVDKGVTAEPCYDCGFSDSLRAHVWGPLNASAFEATLREEGITLSLAE